MKKRVSIALAIALVVLAVPTLALGFEPIRVQPPMISPDLVAQQDTICIPAMVKVHPTLQLAIDKESLYYDCLNPATNQSADLTFTVQVKSNLPFRKQVTITPFQFTENGVPGDILQSYQYVNGTWVLEPWPAGTPAPGTGDVIPVDEQSVFITEVNGETGQVAIPETKVEANGVFPPDGRAIGDIDNHIFEDQVRWHVGPIDWCVTAGYYVGQLCVTVYQN